MGLNVHEFPLMEHFSYPGCLMQEHPGKDTIHINVCISISIMGFLFWFQFWVLTVLCCRGSARHEFPLFNLGLSFRWLGAFVWSLVHQIDRKDFLPHRGTFVRACYLIVVTWEDSIWWNIVTSMWTLLLDRSASSKLLLKLIGLADGFVSICDGWDNLSIIGLPPWHTRCWDFSWKMIKPQLVGIEQEMLGEHMSYSKVEKRIGQFPFEESRFGLAWSVDKTRAFRLLKSEL